MRTPNAALKTARMALCALLLAPLAGCMSDSASYLIDGDNQHTITVLRNQDLFWKRTVDLRVVPTRLPECQESILIPDVPRDAEMALFRAPEDYARPLYFLEVAGEFYALTTEGCKGRHFETSPGNPGTPLGIFVERAGRLVFEAAKAAG